MNRISIIKTYNYVLKEIKTFENEIINGDLLVYDLKGWSNFKNKAFKLKHICMDFYSPFFLSQSPKTWIINHYCMNQWNIFMSA